MIQLATLIFALATPLTSLTVQEEAPTKTWVRGTKVQLTAPKTWEVAPSFPGYFHQDSGSSVMVMEIPGPYAEALVGFTDEEQLKKNGMTLLTSEVRKMGEHEGSFLTLEQNNGRVDITKAIWVFGTTEETVFIMGTVMTVLKDNWFAVAKDCVLSAHWDPKHEIDPYDGLGFRLADTQGLKFLSRVGDMLSFSEDGKDDSKNEGKLTYMIGPALGSGAIEDREAFVDRRLQALPFKILSVEYKEEFDVDELEGWEVVARVSVEGQERITYLAILFEEENYWIAHGQVRLEEREKALTKFPKITRSLKRIKVAPTEPEPENK